MRWIALLFSLAFSVACGDGGSAPPDAGLGGTDAGLDASVGDGTTADDAAVVAPDAGAPDSGLDVDGCRRLELGPRGFQLNLFGQLTGLRYPVTPNLDEAPADRLLLELYDSTTGEGTPPLTTGTFDLALEPDLGACQHCLWIRVDERADGTVPAIYYQSAGELTLEQVSDPFEPVFTGHTGRVVLRRATVGEDGHSTFVEGGDCVSIDALAFDTSPTPGRACASAEACGNPFLEICDPATNRCAPPQCGELESCPRPGQVCVTQYGELFFGACYDPCDAAAPSGTTCVDGERCVQFGVDPHFGLCKDLGGGAVGEPCTVEDNSTSCVDGAICSSLTASCTPSCGFFDAAPGCGAGRLCTLFGVCEPPSAGHAVAIGDPCAADDELASGCAPDGQAFRGICFAYAPAPLVCERACLGDRGCGAGEFCAMRFTSGLGICLPVPVCGDGVVGEIDERCDDGNTVSGDGCSADCRTVEYEVLCAGLPTLALGATTVGDTARALDGFQSSCQLGIARAALYDVPLPGPGRLTVRVESSTNHAIALRAACDEVASEVACAEREPGGVAEQVVLQVTSTAASSLVAVVSAYTVLEEGPFTVVADFVPEVCGDGVVAGNEVCDDGNTETGDGCRSDCREIEYAVYCAAAPVLSTTMLNVGDTTGAPRLYVSGCASDVGSPSGPDRLFRYVAPADGTLHLQLQSDALLTVAVLDGCGAPSAAAELGCNAAFTLGNLEVGLRAGQAITVVVDGFLEGETGAFTLAAAFLE